MFAPITFATDLTAVMSDFPSFPSGVPTAMKIISYPLIAFFISWVKLSLPALIFFFTNSVNPGS